MEEEKIYSYENEKTANFAFAALMRKVYVWMTLALATTGLTAFYVASNTSLITAVVTDKAVLWGLIIAELAIVLILSLAINKLSFAMAAVMFVVYSILNGATFSVIFVVYTMTSIATTFFITAGTFGAMAFVGYTTKRDLSAIGRFLFMALIGLIIASVVNIFVASSTFDWLLSYVGVFIFVGLTAYDSQKIKRMLQEYGTEENDSTQKLALMGSLTLYLDFINMFLYLLRIFGRSK